MSYKALTDGFDPNNYCRLCNRTFTQKSAYPVHLKQVRKMKLTPLKSTPDPNITPDPYGKSNYCQSCKWALSRKLVISKFLLQLMSSQVQKLQNLSHAS